MKKYESVEAILEAAKDTKWNVVTELSKPNACTKELAFLLCQKLFNTIAGMETAMDKLSEAFQATIKGITEREINGIVAPINETLKAVDTKIDEVTESVKNNSCNKNSGDNPTDSSISKSPKLESIKCEPYSTKIDQILPTEVYTEVSEFLPTIPYVAVNNQREVQYYGDFQYDYTGGYHDAADIPEPIKKVMTVLETKFKGKVANSCMATMYKDGESYCPMHSDNESTIGPTSDIYTVSFGADRIMEFRRSDGSIERVELPLEDNSLVVFSRTSQEHWQHSIPKTSESTGIRYSLTFRLIKPYYVNSTLLIGDSNTRYINFGEDKNCLGKWVPGERIKAGRIEDIPAPENIAPYRNIIIHTGVNDVNRYNSCSAVDLAAQLEQKCAAIHKVYPKTKIFLSPALPTKSHDINVDVSNFNEHVVQLTKKHRNLILIDNSIFLDSRTNLLNREYHSRRPGDLLHLGKLGLRCFAMSIKSNILGRKLHINNSMKAFTSLP